MEMLSVLDPAFREYGAVVTGCEGLTQSLTALLPKLFPIPEGIAYDPSVPQLENTPEGEKLMALLFGGMPAQLGCCRGRNNRLNCLEYHRDSEFNLSDGAFILLLALRSQLKDKTIDSSAVKAFLVPAGVMVEIFATTLHYAPCHSDPAKGFRVLAAMSRGSNTERPAHTPEGYDSGLLWARNKWLVAHPDTFEAKSGAVVGITGENLTL